jgi:hypothetical protein
VLRSCSQAVVCCCRCAYSHGMRFCFQVCPDLTCTPTSHARAHFPFICFSLSQYPRVRSSGEPPTHPPIQLAHIHSLASCEICLCEILFRKYVCCCCFWYFVWFLLVIIQSMFAPPSSQSSPSSFVSLDAQAMHLMPMDDGGLVRKGKGVWWRAG